MFLIFVTSAGVNSLGIMSVTDWSGATPDAGESFCNNYI
jgi:hypothetical protein